MKVIYYPIVNIKKFNFSKSNIPNNPPTFAQITNLYDIQRIRGYRTHS